ncbi:MAG: alpha-L-fucosidase, partial [Rikenellaceae bacterium]
MKKLLLAIAICVLAILSCTPKSQPAVATTDNNPLKEWQGLKYGMFIHFGLYSVAGGIWNGKQIMNHARIPVKDYESLAQGFTAEGWNADSVVLLAKNNGMKYIVITSKHHDGFNMYHSKVSPYNVVDFTPAKRDVIGELATACKKHDIALGFYYSLPDWHYPQGIQRGEIDSTTNCTQHVNQLYSPLEHITPELEEYIVTQLKELLTNYGDILTIWFDMGLVTPEQSKRFRETVKAIQPNCLVSGRIMNNCGDYLTLPDNGNVAGFTSIAWDNPASLYGTWGYRSWCERPELSEQISKQLDRLISTVSHGGVFLLNIGPKGDGSVLEYEKVVLRGIGQWVNLNGEAIYNTKPSPFVKMPQGVYITLRDNKLYVINRNRTTVELYGLTNKINKVYSMLDKTNIAYSNLSNILTFNPLSDVTVIEFEGNIDVINPQVALCGSRYILTEDNGITHSAFDAHGYLTTQSNSFKTWSLRDMPKGIYKITIEY